MQAQPKCIRNSTTDRVLRKSGQHVPKVPKDVTTSPFYIAAPIKYNSDLMSEVLADPEVDGEVEVDGKVVGAQDAE